MPWIVECARRAPLVESGCTVRTVLTIAVDSYDAGGRLVGSTLAARASQVAVAPPDVIDGVFAALPPEWLQMTYDELVDHFGQTRPADPTPWEQLSIF